MTTTTLDHSLPPAAPTATARDTRPARGDAIEKEARPHRLRRLLGWGLLLLLALGGAITWYLVRRHATAAQASAQLETVRVDRGHIVARVTATGTVSPLVTVQVGSQVSGRVSALYADFNSLVHKGDLVAEIDPALFRAAVAQARANVAAAKGNVSRAEAQAEDARVIARRNRELGGRKLIAPQEVDTANANERAAVAQVDASRGALQQARAALQQAELNLGYTRIVSPTDGTVISRNVDVGQTVAATLQAPTLFVIAKDLTRMQVDTSVAEADVGRLREGMAATFTVDAYPGRVFRGVVRQVRNNPQTVQNVVTYDAVIDVANPELLLKPGMTANAVFVYGERQDALRVPNAALRFHAPPAWGGPVEKRAASSETRTVWAMREGRAAPVTIQIGVSDGSTTEVVSGELRAGDVLVTDAGGPSATNVPAAMRRGF